MLLSPGTAFFTGFDAGDGAAGVGAAGTAMGVSGTAFRTGGFPAVVSAVVPGAAVRLFQYQ